MTGCSAAWPRSTTSSGEGHLSAAKMCWFVTSLYLIVVVLQCSPVTGIFISHVSSHVSHVCLVWFCRKREARRLFLTMKINLQFYYIPVCKATTPNSSVKVSLLPPLHTPSPCDVWKSPCHHSYVTDRSVYIVPHSVSYQSAFLFLMQKCLPLSDPHLWSELSLP